MTTGVRLTLLEAGHCAHPEWVTIAGGSWRARRFPALFGLIVHPRLGVGLFDAGYAERFFEQTRAFPARLYAWATPVRVEPAQTAVSQLARQGVAPNDVRWIALSHFHADHIAGLRDFPAARLICAREAFAAVDGRTGWDATRRGFLPGLLPSDCRQRLEYVETFPAVRLEEAFAPFDAAWALDEDGSLLAVPLPGHAPGHIGLLVRLDARRSVFLIGDACWMSAAYRENRPPHPIAQRFLSDPRAYAKTLARLRELSRRNPDVLIAPSHCVDVADDLRGRPLVGLD